MKGQEEQLLDRRSELTQLRKEEHNLQQEIDSAAGELEG